MPARVVWLDQAQDDLQAISEYIAAESPKAAAKYVDGILVACAKLDQFPRSGRSYNSHYRVLVVKKHLIFYTHNEVAGEVTITTILDGRRDIAALLDDGQ